MAKVSIPVFLWTGIFKIFYTTELTHDKHFELLLASTVLILVNDVVNMISTFKLHARLFKTNVYLQVTLVFVCFWIKIIDKISACKLTKLTKFTKHQSLKDSSLFALKIDYIQQWPLNISGANSQHWIWNSAIWSTLHENQETKIIWAGHFHASFISGRKLQTHRQFTLKIFMYLKWFVNGTKRIGKQSEFENELACATGFKSNHMKRQVLDRS